MVAKPCILHLRDEAATLQLGKQLASVCTPPCIIFLEGELGAGKTSLVRGFLRGYGYQGVVKSPTYTFVEPYELGRHSIFHFDLYRLQSPAELAHVGIQEYLNPDAICLFEWPARAQEALPTADLICQIDILPIGRQLKMMALTPIGQEILAKLSGILV